MDRNKIDEQDVIDVIITTAHHWMGCGLISPSNITSLLKTTRYQVNKHIKVLKQKQLIKYGYFYFTDKYGISKGFPYRGYKLSKKGEKLYSKQIEQINKTEEKLIDKHFKIIDNG